MTYQVRFRPRAARQLSALPKGVRETIAKVIEALSDNPRPTGAATLKGSPYLRVRVRDYRVVYEVIDDILRMTFIRVGHRRDVYRGL